MKTIYVLLILLTSYGVSHAQSISQYVFGNTGATISGASNSLSFTLGEPVIGLISNGESLGQGFWLGAAASIVLSTEDFSSLENSITVYPNPVRDVVNLAFTDILSEEFVVQVTDISGKTILQKVFENNGLTESISVSNLSSGIYFINIQRSEKQQSKTFKIIKY